MCGIIGYIGSQTATPILLDGLRRLEYRGYDSAGLCVVDPTAVEPRLCLRKRKGKIEEGLAELLQTAPADGCVGIGHTRWATHGPPSDENSHPHLDQAGRIAVVHNGVIENYESLKQRLIQKGHSFQSDTDTEVLAHLIGEHYQRLLSEDASPSGNDHSSIPPRSSSISPSLFGAAAQSEIQNPKSKILRDAVAAALREVLGTYGIAVVSLDCPDVLIAARRGSPLILGLGQKENFLASDASAIVAHTRQVIFLSDHDLALISADHFDVTNLGSDPAKVQVSQIEFSADAVDRGKFPHYMLKEIFEQPQTVRNGLRGRIDLPETTTKFGGLNMSPAELRSIDRIVIVACGTSWHAGLIGEYAIEELAHIPVEVEYASEFRYRNAPLDKHTLVLAITQSGETADTLAGLREARRRGHRVLALCNVVGSTIAREADGGIYLHAGPEIGVASTKAFTSQVTALLLFAVLMGRMRSLPPLHAINILQALEQVPAQMEEVLAGAERIKRIAGKFFEAQNFFFLGRHYNFPVALEGALKLKEISYIHAEGYPAAEMKHGPIALIDAATPAVVLAPAGPMYEKTLSNLEVVRARRGPIIAVATEGNSDIQRCADEVIYVPKTLDPVFPLLGVIPLQLLAYHIATLRGCDVDKPRNLAKSVTVE